MKHLFIALLFILSGQASASIVENIHLDFQSGATFDGTITFNDGYQGMIDTNGLLLGGSYNYNTQFDATWWSLTNQTNPQNYYGQGLLDWLVGGGHYIGLTWNATASALQGSLSLVDTNYSYTFGAINYSDEIVGWHTSSVPESSSLFLLGLGLVGLLARRKFNAK